MIVLLSGYEFFKAGNIDFGTPRSIGKEINLYLFISNCKNIFLNNFSNLNLQSLLFE